MSIYKESTKSLDYVLSLNQIEVVGTKSKFVQLINPIK